jgi:serine protease AprX
MDFVNGRTAPYDDNGHGSHVSGIIAGNGVDSRGAYAGIAPDAHLISLKVLDENARGRISNVIAALEHAIANKAAYNIRVINVSVGAAVTESYLTDPLTLATKRAVDAGIVVVAAAGNLGRNAAGQPQYGAITAPGNAPWVLTVGASSHEGTVTRVDDVVASYSSRGPTALDYLAKPDLMAPGTGIVSLSDATSVLYTSKAEYLLKGSVQTSYKPYLSLSGTSMAAPVVAGTVALMIEANPALTPNLVKGILQYTAQKYNYNPLTQGAGFLNTRGAVQLASFFGNAQPGDAYPTSAHWSRQIIWGNHRLSGGVIKPNATAWAPNVVWGSAFNSNGENIVWGSLCRLGDCENIVWGTFDENIVWGTGEYDLVWGTMDGDENIVWGSNFGSGLDVAWSGNVQLGENIVWGTYNWGENIVWGSSLLGYFDGFNIVWGTFNWDENIVWGTLDDENIVWGTSEKKVTVLGSGGVL